MSDFGPFSAMSFAAERVGLRVVRERDAYGAALAALRARLRGGVYPPGGQLVIGDLAEDLRSSSTPVREALSRLAGEGLVEERRGNGYFAWRLDVTEIVDLYAMHEVVVAAAARGMDSSGSAAAARAAEPRSDATAAFDAVVRSERIFDGLVQSTGNRVLAQHYSQLRDRLAPVRRVEPAVITDLELELASLSAALGADGRAIELGLADYHHRRRSSAQGLARQLRAQSGYSG